MAQSSESGDQENSLDGRRGQDYLRRAFKNGQQVGRDCKNGAREDRQCD
jgi:hypothetical protein